MQFAFLIRPFPLFAILLLAALGCDKGDATKPAAVQPAAPPAPPVQVNVVTIAPRTVPVEFTQVGTTAASRKVEVRARIAGYIQKRLFDEGKPVKEGELLYQIDPREFEVAKQQAEASLLRAQANIDLANRDVARLTPLIQTKVVAQKDLDDAINRRQTAQADAAAAQAAIDKAKLDLSYTKIYSPVNGIIGITQKQEGAYVDDSNNSMLVMALQTDPMYVNFSIPEKTMLSYRHDVEAGRLVIPPDNSFKIIVELLDNTTYEQPGKLTITGFELGATTGTAIFRAEVPNPEGKLIDGQLVKVHVQGATRPNVIAIPQRAVQFGDQGTYALVVVDGKAVIRPITTGDWAPPDWVVTSGLKEGDVVIVDGVQPVMMRGGPGTAVAPVPLTPTTAPSTQPVAAN